MPLWSPFFFVQMTVRKNTEIQLVPSAGLQHASLVRPINIVTESTLWTSFSVYIILLYYSFVHRVVHVSGIQWNWKWCETLAYGLWACVCSNGKVKKKSKLYLWKEKKKKNERKKRNNNTLIQRCENSYVRLCPPMRVLPNGNRICLLLLFSSCHSFQHQKHTLK